MRNAAATLLVITLIAGCSSTAEQLRQAALEAQQFKIDGDIFISSVNEIDGCPRGTRPANTNIDVNSDSNIQNDDGDVKYFMGARSNRSNRCK